MTRGIRITKKIAALLVLLVTLMAVPVCAGPRLPMVRMLSTSTCPACVQMTKVLNEIKAKYKGKLATDTVDLERHPEIAQQYNVRYIPTLLFLDSDGKEVAQKVGYMTLGEVLDVFKKAGVKI